MAPPRQAGFRIVRAAAARPRLLGAALAALAVGLLLPSAFNPSTRILMAWDAGTLLHLALTWTMMARADTKHLRQRAVMQDAGAVVVLALTILASLASLGAIAVELRGLHDMPPTDMPPRLLLVGVTLLCSWLFVQTLFALHYGHDYYSGAEGARKGLAFPGDGAPDYWDFLYFAATIGAASQTSDVTIVSKRMRRFVLAHTILSFLFNTTVLALAINVGASLI
ncbi:MAG TPA: DUF1345 domain-containing protein [Beijerinckiaceae bacterium]